MKIVLIEFIDEARLFIKNYGKEFLTDPDVKVVCIDPKVRVFLLENGITADSTLGYLDNNAQHRMLLAIEEWCTKILNEFKFKDSFGIERGYQETLRVYLYCYLSHLLWVTEILKGIRQKHNVQKIYVCLPQDLRDMYSVKAFISTDERFLGVIARQFCERAGIEFQFLPRSSGQSSFKDDFMKSALRFLAKALAFLELAFIKDMVQDCRQVMVVPALSYRMNYLLKDIKKQYPQAKCVMVWEAGGSVKQEMYRIYLSLTYFIERFKKGNLLEGMINLDLIKESTAKNPVDQERLKEAFDILVRKLFEPKESLFVYDGICLQAFLRDKIQKSFTRELLSLNHSTLVLANVFKTLKPKLLMSMYSTGIYYMMGELAGRLGFKSLNISHGTHVPPNNKYEEIENYRLSTSVIINTYSDVAVQTPWADKFLDHYADKRPRVYSGPLLYSVTDQKDRRKLREEVLGENKEGKIIVYATTQKSRQGQRFHITETLDEYLASLADIVNAVNQLPDVYLLIRPHPVSDLTEADFCALLPRSDRISIIRKGSFSSILSAADLLISYSSTVIEEAIQNDIPVLLYDQWDRYNHFNVPQGGPVTLKRDAPAYYLTRSVDLSSTIHQILSLENLQGNKQKAWLDYRYPAQYKENFFHYVQQAIKSENVAITEEKELLKANP